MQQKSVKDHSSDWRKFALAGYSLIFLTFGVIGGWAAVAKVDRAVVASGWVTVETNRKTLQHLEGGIVREILVKEGEHVKAGQLLIRLEKTQAQANSDILSNQLMSGLALEARLLAERDEKKEITWPEEFNGYENQPYLVKLVDDEVSQFNERRKNFEAQISILEAKVKQLNTEVGGIQIEKEAAEKQVGFINKELVALRRLNERKLYPTNRLFEMERQRTQYEGMIGKAISNTSKVKQTIDEINVQMAQVKQKFKEDVATSLLDVRQKLSDFKQKNIVAGDVLKRVDIKAPRGGVVQNLKVFTLGQVIRPGEPMLDVVPDDERLIIQAQFSPVDIDVVHQGQNAEVRFPAFHARTIPVMIGQIETLSTDRMIDEASKQPYYLGSIFLNKTDIPDEYRQRLRAGMPAEIIVSAGERSVMSYLTSPLVSALRKTFIEH